MALLKSIQRYPPLRDGSVSCHLGNQAKVLRGAVIEKPEKLSTEPSGLTISVWRVDIGDFLSLPGSIGCCG